MFRFIFLTRLSHHDCWFVFRWENILISLSYSWFYWLKKIVGRAQRGRQGEGLSLSGLSYLLLSFLPLPMDNAPSFRSLFTHHFPWKAFSPWDVRVRYPPATPHPHHHTSYAKYCQLSVHLPVFMWDWKSCGYGSCMSITKINVPRDWHMVGEQ